MSFRVGYFPSVLMSFLLLLLRKKPLTRIQSRGGIIPFPHLLAPFPKKGMTRTDAEGRARGKESILLLIDDNYMVVVLLPISLSLNLRGIPK